MQRNVVVVIGLAALCASSVAFAQGPQLTLSQTAGCPAAQPTSPSSSGSGDSSVPRPDTTGPSASTNLGQPDILLLVGFSADQLTFNSQPHASIRLCWGSDSLHIIERRNLPSPVVAGTTYRNVYIAAELRAYLNPECLAQRLGVGSAPAPANVSCAAIGITTPTGTASRAPAILPTSVSRRPQ